MIEILVLLGLIFGVILLAAAAKLVFALVAGLLHGVFWIVGGLFKLILLPFQLLGGLVLAALLLPLLLVAVPVLLAVGVPLLLVGAGFTCLLALGLVVAVFAGLLGWC
jgi:hypothetical protein